MFSPHSQSHDPYHHFRTALFSFPLPTYTSSRISSYANSNAYNSRGFAHRQAPAYAPNPRRSASDIDTSDFSEQSEFDLDTDVSSTRHDHLHTSAYYSTRHQKSEPDFDLTSTFKRTQIRVHKRAAQELRSNDEVLILPPILIHLKISVYAHHGNRTIRAAVAGDMRLRDVVKQILPREYLGEAQAYMKSRGEWIESSAPTKVSDVAALGQFAINERREVELRIVIGGSGKERNRGRDDGNARHEWERERGRVERMRVYQQKEYLKDADFRMV